MMNNRFKFRFWHKPTNKMIDCYGFNKDFVFGDTLDGIGTTYNPAKLEDCILMQCTGLKDVEGNLIYEGDVIVIPNEYPFYDYKNKEDMKQDLNETQGKIKGESVLNYVGIVENIYNCWQYVYLCVNPEKRGISNGINNHLNEYGFAEDENSHFEVIGNIYENADLLQECE